MEKLTFKQKLLEAQKQIGAIKKDSDNPYFKSKYFDINAILAEVKPKLNALGLVLTQELVTKDGKTGIETAIFDADGGDAFAAFCEIPQGATPQQTGSSITYFRRYALQSMLALEAEDDDANEVSGKRVAKKVTDSDEPF